MKILHVFLCHNLRQGVTLLIFFFKIKTGSTLLKDEVLASKIQYSLIYVFSWRRWSQISLFLLYVNCCDLLKWFFVAFSMILIINILPDYLPPKAREHSLPYYLTYGYEWEEDSYFFARHSGKVNVTNFTGIRTRIANSTFRADKLALTWRSSDKRLAIDLRDRFICK